MTVDELRDLVAQGRATREDVVMTVARLITPMWPPPNPSERRWPVRRGDQNWKFGRTPPGSRLWVTFGWWHYEPKMPSYEAEVWLP